MADDDGPATFSGICNNAFYFDVSESVVDSDTFCSSEQSLTRSLRCKDNMILLVTAAGQFQLQHVMTNGQTLTESRFHIHIYHDESLEEARASPVMLYAEKDGRKLVACCRGNNEIYPEVMDLPARIEERSHKALFQLIEVGKETYMFQSTTTTSKFLGFTQVDGNPSLKKLVLCCQGPDGVNESAEFSLSQCDP